MDKNGRNGRNGSLELWASIEAVIFDIHLRFPSGSQTYATIVASEGFGLTNASKKSQLVGLITGCGSVRHNTNTTIEQNSSHTLTKLLTNSQLKELQN